jgi:3-methyladenine DNA glycosylase AlkC
MEPFKNIYNQRSITKLANEISLVYPSFLKDKFIVSLINETWEKKELKDRIRAISLSLGEFLPCKYLDALAILEQIQEKFNGLFHLIFPDFVEVFGLEYYDYSLKALKQFTQNCSSEFAIRPFILKYPETIEVLKIWAEDKSEHVRRLASEGCRPRLPWAMALPCYKKNPTRVLEVLELLKDDTSTYVQKSVANNLNDISKDNPDIAKKIFKHWYGYSKNRNWILKHGARTLLKHGDSEVLSIFGYLPPDGIMLSSLEVDKKVILGKYLNFSFSISSQKPLGKLRIEYKLGFLRQKGKVNYKVFKISEKSTQEKTLHIKKSHHFKK